MKSSSVSHARAPQEKQKAMHLTEPSGNGDMVTSCRQRPRLPRDTEVRCHALAQRNGGKVSQKRSGKEEGGGGRERWSEGRRSKEGGRVKYSGLKAVPEAQRQVFWDLARDCSSWGLQFCGIPITLSLSLSLSLSTGARHWTQMSRNEHGSYDIQRNLICIGNEHNC